MCVPIRCLGCKLDQFCVSKDIGDKKNICFQVVDNDTIRPFCPCVYIFIFFFNNNVINNKNDDGSKNYHFDGNTENQITNPYLVHYIKYKACSHSPKLLPNLHVYNSRNIEIGPHVVTQLRPMAVSACVFSFE